MKSKLNGAVACLIAILALIASSASGSERLVRILPNEGQAMIVKAFTVSSGSTIVGAEFATDGTTTVFPAVSLLRGPAASVHEATLVATVENVSSGSGTTVSVTWPSAIEVTESGTYFVVVHMPVTTVRVGLVARPGPTGSYVANSTDDTLLPVIGAFSIGLVPNEQNAVLGGNDALKAGSGEPEVDAQLQTFLRSGTPNPTNRVTAIEFGLARPGFGTLTIYDVSGREVRRLGARELGAGPHRVQWDGRDGQGRSVAAGVYLVNLRLGEKLFTERVVITK
jgi:hypothetical protein